MTNPPINAFPAHAAIADVLHKVRNNKQLYEPHAYVQTRVYTKDGNVAFDARVTCLADNFIDEFQALRDAADGLAEALKRIGLLQMYGDDGAYDTCQQMYDIASEALQKYNSTIGKE